MNKITLTLILFATFCHALFAQEAGTLKILAIGNSFSEDAIENYLYDLAKTNNKKMIIGNLYIGGAPLKLHVENAKTDKASYSYRKTNIDGTKSSTKSTSIAQALKDEDWDYISLQQASPYSGKHTIIMESLPALVAYVNSLKPSNAQLIYHQTWAYQNDSDHKGFSNYERSQEIMYKHIAQTTKKINKSGVFAFVVPAGTAIQNARTSSIGDKYTRDGYHLQLDYGRFTAACTWYEMLFKLDVRENSYKPEKVSDLQARIAKEAAHKAVKKPFKVSKINL
ncbi:DUF4886 domain-containing protein [Sphingobacterium faecale]|uniref:DUF4886 domain-containing protein n=1 Tax=Sphingobacterium faecale TaxID=2803775 RepID=A0ABS1R9S0_9SPHI|nr:DUF4886 domain-containing protein [Sphingobacterium faecale]MBL1410576.1 DUF4886 domain-containing protein [Sphingobacterium faecale]